MLHIPFTSPTPPARPGPPPAFGPSAQVLSTPASPIVNTFFEPFSDARTHGPEGPTRAVTLPNASSSGSSAISKSQDRERCVVAGRDCVSSPLL